MGKINILPAKVYNRIAAGEVVERPYSVVKELVENSIDAGATEIQIYIENGGKQSIRVVDNGCGIERDDLQSAFLSHATSKIANADDLENIITLGFRGEAIASIASVSKMTITSKTKEGKCYRLKSEGGELGEIMEVAGEDGTEALVETLFYNTPVRLGFLKKDKGEETEITTFVSRFILNRSDIAFAYYVNGEKVMQSFGEGDDEALVNVYGASILNNCYKLDAERNGIRIKGYIGNQSFYKPNKSYQSLFVNGRYVTNNFLATAVSSPYNDYLMKRQYPFYVLHITMPTEVVDVNVHPNKLDVRFSDNRLVYGTIFNVIKAVLDGQASAIDYVVQSPQIEQVSMIEPIEKKEEKKIEEPKKPSFVFPTLSYEEAQKEIEYSAPIFAAKKKGMDLPFENVTKAKKGFIPIEQIGNIPLGVNMVEEGSKEFVKKETSIDKLKEQFPDLYFERKTLRVDDSKAEASKKVDELDAFAQNKKYLEELEKKSQADKIDVGSFAYVGKFFNTYLMYENKDDVYIIDQHAAHERLIFNRLKEKMQRRALIAQPMLLPYTLNLNYFEADFLREHIDDIQEIGFELQEFENSVFKVFSVPVDLQYIDIGKFFNEILGDINGLRAIKIEDILRDRLASAACKAAVKGGMDLTKEEVDELFRLIDGNMGLKCPHGRPVVVKLTKKEIEKMFKRIV